MKTKLVPLVLLIPAFVIAQPVYQAPVPQPPQVGIPQNLPAKSPNPVDALSNAKTQSKQLKSKSSNGDVGSSWANNCTNGCGTNTTTYT
jgi:hypothetical protein